VSAWTLSDVSLAAAAEARRRSLGLRAAHNAAFALSVGLTTGSVLMPLIWYPIIVALMAGDVWAGRAFLTAAPEQKRALKLLFVSSSVLMIAAFMGMALAGAIYGGEAGRMSAAFMAAGSLVTVMVLMVEAPLFMALSAAPGFALLALLPLVAHAPGGAGGVSATLGLYLTLGAFASHLIRTAVQHMGLYRRQSNARDEAENRRAEAELRRAEAERANRVKSQFLLTMTHELRTPLNAVINYAEMIAEETQGAVAQDAGRITAAARRLLSLIERILDFSAMDTGEVAFKAEHFSASDVVRDATQAHRAVAEANGDVIALDGPADIAMVGDRARFRQCVDCLISNAAKFTRNGFIAVTVRQDGEAVCVAVKDNGPGIGAAQLERVFEAFAREEGATTRTADGLGLGLASARKVARAMGGDISVESALGRGARFELRLPLRIEARAIAAAA
jgi:signal transduction histidine kinase